MNPITNFRLWFAHWKLRLVQREIRNTSDDVQDARLEGDWIRAKALNDYAMELATERRRLNAHINHLMARKKNG